MKSQNVQLDPAQQTSSKRPRGEQAIDPELYAKIQQALRELGAAGN